VVTNPASHGGRSHLTWLGIQTAGKLCMWSSHLLCDMSCCLVVSMLPQFPLLWCVGGIHGLLLSWHDVWRLEQLSLRSTVETSIARQCFGKYPPTGINMHTTVEEFWRWHFMFGPSHQVVASG
jgi:hypothetical protein